MRNRFKALAGLVLALALAAPARAQLGVGKTYVHLHDSPQHGGSTLKPQLVQVSTLTVTSSATEPFIAFSANGSTPTAPNTQYANSIVKAWITYDSVNHVLLDSFNISSVTEASPYYQLNFSTPFANTNYAVICDGDDASGARTCAANSSKKYVNSVEVIPMTLAGTTPWTQFTAVVFGTQGNLASTNGTAAIPVVHHHTSDLDGGSWIAPSSMTVTYGIQAASVTIPGTSLTSTGTTVALPLQAGTTFQANANGTLSAPSQACVTIRMNGNTTFSGPANQHFFFNGLVSNDPQHMFDVVNASDSVKVPASGGGTYLVSFGMSWAADSGARLQCFLEKNNGSVVSFGITTGGAYEVMCETPPVLLELSAGDTLNAYVDVATGSAVSDNCGNNACVLTACKVR